MYNMLVRRLVSPEYHRVTFTSHPTRLPAAQRSFGSALQMHLVSPGLNNGTANRRLNRVAEGHEVVGSGDPITISETLQCGCALFSKIFRF